MQCTRGYLLACVVSLLSLCPSVARPLSPAKELASYSHRNWVKRDGLPHNTVLAIAQTRDGYLWAGTYEGLARFDGANFKVFSPRSTPEIGGKLVTSLCAARDGALWIGTSGGGISVMRDGAIERVCCSSDETPMTVRTIYEDRSGNVWAVTSQGLQLYKEGCLATTFTWSQGLPKGAVTGITEDRNGRLLVAVGGRILIVEGTTFVEFPLPASFPGKPRVVATDTAGTLWIGTYEHGVVSLRDGRMIQYNRRNGLSSDSITVILPDSKGAVWVGTRMNGVSRITGSKVSASLPRTAMTSGEVLSFLEDREGNIWVGVSGFGLNCLAESKLTTYSSGYGDGRDAVFSVYAANDGNIIAGTADQMVMRLVGGRLVPHPQIRKRLAGVPVTFCRDRRGALWIGTTQGLYRLVGETLAYYPMGFVASVVEDSHGLLWVGNHIGIWYYLDGKFKEYPGWWRGLMPQSFTEGRNGTMWVGTRYSGMFEFKVQRDSICTSKGFLKLMAHYSAKEGLKSAWVSSATEDRDGGMWVATYGGGLNLIRDGKLRNLDGGGPPEDGFHMVLDDGRGSLWLSSNNGIYTVAKKDIENFVAGKTVSYPWTHFGINAGMVNDECNGGGQSAGMRMADGRLWFPTAVGVVVVDPGSLPRNVVPPTVVFEAIRLDRRAVPLAGHPSLPHGDGELEFGFVGISLSAPDQVQYNILLEGFDKTWREVGTRAIHSYTNIPPGTYTFRVQARNADGVWNRDGASFRFTLEPHYYQTWWFRLLCLVLACVAGTVVFVMLRRKRERQLRAARLESQLARARLQVLEMQVQPHFLFNTLNSISVLIREDADKATRMINRLSEFVRMGLDRSGVQEIPLEEEFKFVGRYLEIEAIRFADRLTVDQKADGETHDALVPTMILQPLVENAVRHGISRRRGPVSINVEAFRTNGDLTLLVRDTGAGLPAGWPQAKREGIGLSNTRARLEQLYGPGSRLRLSPNTEGGVDAELTIPFHKEPVQEWNDSES